MASGSNSWPTAATRRRRCGCPTAGPRSKPRLDAPGYWRKIDGAWFAMTLGGLRWVDPATPVCHVSYYEADAFARWAGKDLPTEAEWEVAAKSGVLDDAFGIVWQWTRSAYAPYPGYRARPARSANTTASSWSIRWCCAALRSRRPRAIRARAIAIFSIRRPAGNSPDCGLPIRTLSKFMANLPNRAARGAASTIRLPPTSWPA